MILAASTHSSTTDWIVGSIAVVAFLFFSFWILRRVVRLIRWPFRAMRRPAPTGLGGNYEQMVRAQPQVVLPQPRRTRQPEPERRLPFPPHSTAQAVADPPRQQQLSLWQRLRRVLIPAWLSSSLVFLGVVFVFFKPIGASWRVYGAALFVAVVSALWEARRRRRRYFVLHRDDQGMVVWIRWGKKPDEPGTPPVVFAQPQETPVPDPALDEPSSSPEPDGQTALEEKLDQLFLQRLITAEEYERLRCASLKDAST